MLQCLAKGSLLTSLLLNASHAKHANFVVSNYFIVEPGYEKYVRRCVHAWCLFDCLCSLHSSHTESLFHFWAVVQPANVSPWKTCQGAGWLWQFIECIADVENMQVIFNKARGWLACRDLVLMWSWSVEAFYAVCSFTFSHSFVSLKKPLNLTNDLATKALHYDALQSIHSDIIKLSLISKVIENAVK